MFIPLHDSTPLKVIRFQAVTVIIIALNLVMYATTGAFATDQVMYAVATGWGLVPGELTGLAGPAYGYDPVPEPVTLITYQFLHADWMHILGNMLFLFVFGPPVEDRLSRIGFLAFYLVGGVAAGGVPTGGPGRVGAGGDLGSSFFSL